MDVRNTRDIEPVIEHEGSVSDYYLVRMDELGPDTVGNSLQFIDEFELESGVQLNPHFHPTHEFYYILDGGGLMQVGNQQRTVGPRDLVVIRPNEPHTLTAGTHGVRALAFATTPALGVRHTVCEMPSVEEPA